MSLTPKPWIYGTRRDGSMWLSLGDYKVGQHMQGDLVATKEDADLICAAPDLLEALRQMVANSEADKKEYRDCHKKAVAALSKAEGK